MVHLIIEGCDRTGKDTIVQGISSLFDNVVIRHFSFPKGETDDQKKLFQQQYFTNEFSLASRRTDFSTAPGRNSDIWIWNRGHLGEFVYGTLYRNTEPEKWVLDMEKIFWVDQDPTVFLLLLTGNVKVLSGLDDNKSFRHSSEARYKEQMKFVEAYHKSSIQNKLQVRVTNDREFLPKEEILQQVKEFIGYELH